MFGVPNTRTAPAESSQIAPATAAPLALAVSGLSKRFGRSEVLRDIDLSVEPGTLVALLGPSGCGKTTLLRLVAGLEAPDQGTIRIGDQMVSGPGGFVAPERRRIGLVFQDWALFPHLSVARNVAYGLHRGPDRAARVEQALAMVGLEGLGDRMPSTLSGGQQQRVALARAVAPEPAVLLLDEPFSNLDTSLRTQVRSEVHELLVRLGITTVVVTHDQEEAFVLGDQVAVMHAGRIVQQATPAELYRRPATTWVADFVGDANLLAGEAHGLHADTVVGPVPLLESVTGPVEVLVRPEECHVAPGGDASVELVEFYGHDTRYLIDRGGVRLSVRESSAPTVQRGAQVAVTYTGGPTTAYVDGLPAGDRTCAERQLDTDEASSAAGDLLRSRH